MIEESIRRVVTVVVPARNRPDLLQVCLDRLTQQTADPDTYEVLVCDDGSTEDLASVVASFEGRSPVVRLLRQQPQGPAAARNLGVRRSRGTVVVFVDSDVIPDPAFLRSLCEALARNPPWLAAEARVEAIGGDDSPLWDAPTAHGGAYPSGAIAYRRDVLVAAGGFDEAFTMPACEDVELAARVLPKGPIGYVPEAVVYHPRRRITFRTCWRWRTFWWFTAILAGRYGFLGWPTRLTRFPRLRTAQAAVVNLPAGRVLEALPWLWRSPKVGTVALVHAMFDVVCGLAALPEIVLKPFPERKNYLMQPGAREVASLPDGKAETLG